jgi:hypothetical protein
VAWETRILSRAGEIVGAGDSASGVIGGSAGCVPGIADKCDGPATGAWLSTIVITAVFACRSCGTADET